MATAVSTKVPFVDLKAQYAAIKEDIDAAVSRVIGNASFIMGEEVEAFEREFAEYTGFRHVVGVGNGTDALQLALRACGLQRGDDVVAPAHTFIATTEAITRADGNVRLADVSDATFCMTAESLEAVLTPSTRVVIPVPIYGNPAGLDEIVTVARRRGLTVVVDAAQAHGARLHGARMGDLADVACYSFYPGKNLGAYGDGGAVATNDEEIAKGVRMWRNHGRLGKFDHEFEGVNSRLDGLQGAVLRAKLRYLDSWCARRRRAASMYREALDGISGLRLPEESDGAEHVYHLYVVRVPKRDRIRESMAKRGVATGVHYPSPIHLLPAYGHLNLGRGSFPVAEAICESILSLPMYPEMTSGQVHRVASELRESLS